MSVTACLGGWCSKRAGCPNYEVTGKARMQEPSQRLCVKGADGVRITHAHDRSEQARRMADEETAMWARDFVRMTGETR